MSTHKHGCYELTCRGECRPMRTAHAAEGEAPPPPDLGQAIRAAKAGGLRTAEARRDHVMAFLTPEPPSDTRTFRTAKAPDPVPPPPDMFAFIRAAAGGGR